MEKATQNLPPKLLLSKDKEISRICLEDAVVLDSVLPLIDTESGQVIISGILDHNGSMFDAVQLAALVIEQPGSGDGNLHQAQFVTGSDCQGISMISLPQQGASSSDYLAGNIVTLDQDLSSFMKRNMMQSLDQSTVLLTVAAASEEDSSAIRYDQPSSLTCNISTSGNSSNGIEEPVVFPSTSEPLTQREENLVHEIPVLSDEIEPPGKGQFRCTVCSKTFLKFNLYNRHKQEHLDDKAFVCKICQDSFNFEFNLKLHMIFHEAEATGCLQCKNCPAKFSRLASLKSHLKVHEKEEMVTCQQCGDEFPTTARLNTHLEDHKNVSEIGHRCKVCNQSFSDSSAFKEHSRGHAIVRQQLKALSSRRRKSRLKYSATSGMNSTTQTSTLTQQALRLDKKKKLSCTTCGKRFQKPSQLVRHVRIHTGEKPFKCTKCDKSFNQKGTLESHISCMHDKVRKFVCNLCQCNFSQRGNLRAHVKKLHAPPAENEKGLKCEECSCFFRRLATLNNHIAKVHSVTTTPSVNDETVRLKSSMQDCGEMPTKSETENIIFGEVCAKVQNHFEVPPVLSAIVHTTNINSDNCATVTIPSVNTNSRENVGDGIISEVNFAHEEEGTAKRYLIKVKKIGQEKWHMCTYCTKAFRKPSDLIRHVRTHTLERPYKCHHPQCSKAFAVKSTLNTHLQVHGNQKAEMKWKCRLCHKAFSAFASLRTHERLHSSNRPFKCSHEGCGKTFKTNSHRHSHMKVHNKLAQGSTKTRRKVLRASETSTGKKIDLPDALKITPDGLVPVPTRCALSSTAKNPGDAKSRPYRCLICPSAFKKSSHLKQHHQIHSGEKPFACGQCQRRFVSSGVLKNHIKTHQGDRIRPYKCEICQISFTTSGSLKRHTTTHTNSRPYLCPFCKKSFKTNVSCRKHIKIHCRGEVSTANINSSTDNDDNGNEVDTTVVKNNNNNNNTPITIQVCTSNVQNSQSIMKPVTVSKIHQIERFPKEGFIAIKKNDVHPSTSSIANSGHCQLINMDKQESTNHSKIKGSTTSQSVQIGEAAPTVFSDSLYSIQTTSTETDSSISSKNVQVTHVVGSPLSNPSVVVRNNRYNPTVIEVNSSSKLKPMGSGVSVNKVAVTKLSPVPKASLTSIPKLKSSNSNPVEKVARNHPQADLRDNPVVIRVESITPDAFKSSKASCSSTLQPSTIATSSKTNLPESNAANEVQNIKQKIILESNKNGKMSQCQTCRKTFKKHSDLVRHIRIHTGEKPFTCHLCGKCFRVKSTRDTHMRIHEIKKTVSCEVCHNMFATMSSLKVHMRLHSGSKPFKCNHCDRHFRTTGHLQAHSKSHYKCQSQRQRKAVNHSSLPSSSSSSLQQSQIVRPNVKLNVVEETPNNLTEQTINISSEHSMKNAFDIKKEVQQQPKTPNALSQIEVNGIDPNTLTNSECLQFLGNLQVSLDNLQNIQIAGMDLNCIQSDDLLNSFILITPGVQNMAGNDGTTEFNHANFVGASEISLALSQVTDPCASTVTIGSLVGSMLNEKDSSGQYSSSSSSTVLNSFPISSVKPFENAFSDCDPFLTVASDNQSLSSFGMNQNSNSFNSTPHSNASMDLTLLNDNRPNNKQCPDCGRMFLKPSQMLRHRRTHTGLKPYVCGICSSTFSQKSSLDTHILYTHSDVRPFSCPNPKCAFRTVQKAALKKHWSRAHPQLSWNEVDKTCSGSTRVETSMASTTTQINITTGVKSS